MAPVTATVSALSNIYNNYSFGGLSYFGIEVFKQETTVAVMTAILIHDVFNPKTPKNPKNRAKYHIRSAFDLFGIQAVHGGMWRSPYKAGSILGELAMMLYFLVEGIVPRRYHTVLSLILSMLTFVHPINFPCNSTFLHFLSFILSTHPLTHPHTLLHTLTPSYTPSHPLTHPHTISHIPFSHLPFSTIMDRFHHRWHVSFYIRCHLVVLGLHEGRRT